MRSISAEGLPAAIERQAAAGVAEADVVVILTDGQAGVQPGDAEILEWLRTTHPGKAALLAVNKCENQAKAALLVRCGGGGGCDAARQLVAADAAEAEALKPLAHSHAPPPPSSGRPPQNPRPLKTLSPNPLSLSPGGRLLRARDGAARGVRHLGQRHG